MEVSTAEPVLEAPKSTRGLVAVLVLCGIGFLVVLLWRPVVGGLIGGASSYEFIQIDPGTGDPVTWDHCLAIRYQVNPDGAPEDWREIVDGAFADIEKHSGFVFKDAGETRNRVISGMYTPGATRGEPILIIWSSQGRIDSLQGSTVGLGGGAAVQVDGRRRLVTGSIALDSEAHSRTYDAITSRDQQLILEHEIGHVLGLDHVADPRQLMAASYTGQDGLGRGDINGLEKLHDVPCG